MELSEKFLTTVWTAAEDSLSDVVCKEVTCFPKAATYSNMASYLGVAVIVFAAGKLQRELALSYLLLWDSRLVACMTTLYSLANTALVGAHIWSVNASRSH